MGVVNENTLDRLYHQVVDILKRQPLPEDQLRELIEKATTLKCGFVVEKGKPGTLRLSPFVPANTIFEIDMDYAMDIGVDKITFPDWEKFQ